MNGLLNKNTIVIGIIVIIITILVIAVPYVLEIGPQFLTIEPESEYNFPEQPSDESIKVILDSVKEMDGRELFQYSMSEIYNEDYKSAYNLYKYLIEEFSNDDLMTDEDLSAIYFYSGVCYSRVGNFDEAIRLFDLAYKAVKEEDRTEYFEYKILSHRAISYYNSDVYYGFNNSEVVAYIMENVLTLETDQQDKQAEYIKENTAIKISLIKLYSFSSDVINYERVISLYKELLLDNPDDIGLSYSLALALISNGDIEEAKELSEKFDDFDYSKDAKYTIGARIAMAEGDADEAKKNIDRLKKYAIGYSTKVRYNQLSAMYYNLLGDKEKGREYLTKVVEIVNEEVYNYHIIKLENELGANFDYIREKLENERVNRGIISFELAEE